jgi:hypothetical protein
MNPDLQTFLDSYDDDDRIVVSREHPDITVKMLLQEGGKNVEAFSHAVSGFDPLTDNQYLIKVDIAKANLYWLIEHNQRLFAGYFSVKTTKQLLSGELQFK